MAARVQNIMPLDNYRNPHNVFKTTHDTFSTDMHCYTLHISLNQRACNRELVRALVSKEEIIPSQIKKKKQCNIENDSFIILLLICMLFIIQSSSKPNFHIL